MTMKLGDIKIYNPWDHAPNGTILQMIAGARVIAGMRTTFKAENTEQNAFGGEHAGELIRYVFERPALRSTLEIAWKLSLVKPYRSEPQQFLFFRAGVLLRHQTETNVYFVWSRLPEGTSAGCICVASDNPDFLIGGSYRQLDKSQLIGVARGVDLGELQQT